MHSTSATLREMGAASRPIVIAAIIGSLLQGMRTVVTKMQNGHERIHRFEASVI